VSDAPRPGGRGEYSLTGKVAVVSGGSSGIGAAVATRLADAGAAVWIGYNLGHGRATDLAARLPGGPHRALHLPMLDSAGIAAAAAAVEAESGRVDVLVNSAAVTRAVPHHDLDALDDHLFDTVLATNVRGPFATIRAFRRLLMIGGDGVIVNISSLSASTGLGSSIAYCASKAALDTMGMSLARVLGPDIRVVTVSPAAVATDFVPGRTRAAVERQAAESPLRTVTEADDVALAVMAAVVHLRQTTGSIITVDAGRHL
jgi:3-oxoacyl-[acyl-carrier protein] reductase